MLELDQEIGLRLVLKIEKITLIILQPTRGTWEPVGPRQAIILNQLIDQVTQKNLQSCCQNEIDVVYTWVNGSDPKLLESIEFHVAKLKQANISVEFQVNQSS